MDVTQTPSCEPHYATLNQLDEEHSAERKRISQRAMFTAERHAKLRTAVAFTTTCLKRRSVSNEGKFMKLSEYFIFIRYYVCLLFCSIYF